MLQGFIQAHQEAPLGNSIGSRGRNHLMTGHREGFLKEGAVLQRSDTAHLKTLKTNMQNPKWRERKGV